MKRILMLAVLLTLGGCASKPPAPIAKVPHDNPSLLRVRMDIDKYLGAEVRWGGVISRVENRADETWIEIVRYQLSDSGRPRSSGDSDGRFIASFRDFIDPVVYEVGRPLTVVGKIADRTTRNIGDYDYLFAVVAVEGSFLWKKQSDLRYTPYPYYYWHYDPFFPHHHRHHPHFW